MHSNSWLIQIHEIQWLLKLKLHRRIEPYDISLSFGFTEFNSTSAADELHSPK